MKQLLTLTAILLLSASCRTANYNWHDQGNIETGVRYVQHNSHLSARITSNRLIRRTGERHPHSTIIYRNGCYFVVINEDSFYSKSGRKILTRKQVGRVVVDWAE